MDKTEDLGEAIKNMYALYEKAKRFLSPNDRTEIARRTKELTEFLEDLIW